VINLKSRKGAVAFAVLGALALGNSALAGQKINPANSPQGLPGKISNANPKINPANGPKGLPGLVTKNQKHGGKHNHHNHNHGYGPFFSLGFVEVDPWVCVRGYYNAVGQWVCTRRAPAS
jgi:hypothetical protein